MPRFVALLRGLNVGRAKRVAMADLRVVFESLGYGNVRTLLNSGNAVFDGEAVPEATHAQCIRAAVVSKLGVDALVVVKSAKVIDAIVAGNPLAATADNPSRLLVAFTSDARSLSSLGSLAKTASGDEELHIGKHAAYLRCANGILESKTAVALLAGLGRSGTTRNWSTVTKLQALLQDAA